MGNYFLFVAFITLFFFVSLSAFSDFNYSMIAFFISISTYQLYLFLSFLSGFKFFSPSVSNVHL